MLTLFLCLSASKRDYLPNRRMTKDEKEELDDYMDEFDQAVDALGIEIDRTTRKIVRKQLKDYVKSNSAEEDDKVLTKKYVPHKDLKHKKHAHLIRKKIVGKRKEALRKFIAKRKEATLY